MSTKIQNLGLSKMKKLFSGSQKFLQIQNYHGCVEDTLFFTNMQKRNRNVKEIDEKIEKYIFYNLIVNLDFTYLHI